MMEVWWITYLIIPTASALVGFITKSLMTRRERTKSDLEIINQAITPLLSSIRELTEQNNSLVARLTDEQTKVLQYMQKNKELLEERSELIAKIDKLTKQVELLKKMIRDLPGKEQKDN